MVIGLLTLELHIPAAQSLKDKRQVLKSLQSRLRNQFNVSVAEVEGQNNRQRAVIAVACVATDGPYAHGLLARAVGWVERTRLDCTLVDYQIEIL